MGRLLRRITALVLATIVLLMLTLSACTSAFRTSMMDVDTYKRTLAQQNVYQDLLPFVIPVILEENQAELGGDSNFHFDLNDINEFMTQDDWRAVSNQLLPPEWLQTSSESVLDSLFLIMQGDFSRTENLVDFNDIIARLQGESGQMASQTIISASPDCTAEQVTQLRAFNIENGDIFPLCNPPQLLREKSITLVSQWFSQLGTQLAISVQENENRLTIQQDYANLLYLWVKLDSQISLLGLICPLGLIGLMVLLVVRTLKSFGRWVGWTLLITGIVIILLMFTIQSAVFDSFDAIGTASSELERFQAQLTAGFFRSIYANMSGMMLFQSGLLILAGFILLAISYIARSGDEAVPRGSVLITEDGRIISSTASRRQTSEIARSE